MPADRDERHPRPAPPDTAPVADAAVVALLTEIRDLLIEIRDEMVVAEIIEPSATD